MHQNGQQTELRDAFRMREYEAVLAKISDARSDVAKVEMVYPLAIAAIYAWVFTTPPPVATLWRVAVLIPVGIALLGLVRLYSRRRHMTVLESYVRELESEVYSNERDLGWERRYAKENPLKGLIWLRAGLGLTILCGTIWIAWNAGPLFQELQAESMKDLEVRAKSVGPSHRYSAFSGAPARLTNHSEVGAVRSGK